jgi:hypothetical protein
MFIFFPNTIFSLLSLLILVSFIFKFEKYPDYSPFFKETGISY